MCYAIVWQRAKLLRAQRRQSNDKRQWWWTGRKFDSSMARARRTLRLARSRAASSMRRSQRRDGVLVRYWTLLLRTHIKRVACSVCTRAGSITVARCRSRPRAYSCYMHEMCGSVRAHVGTRATRLARFLQTIVHCHRRTCTHTHRLVHKTVAASTVTQRANKRAGERVKRMAEG